MKKISSTKKFNDNKKYLKKNSSFNFIAKKNLLKIFLFKK